MKKTLFIFLLFANYSFASVINVTNPGNGNDIRANLVTAYNSAVDGDIITIPTGSFIITPPTVTITKKVSVVGTDSTNTILIRSSATSDASLSNVAMITFNGSTWSLSPSGVRVQGIRFKSKVPSVNDAGSDGLSLAADQGLTFINVSGFEVKLCSFWYFGNGGIRVQHRDYFARGLIHKCGFYLNAKGLTGLGLGYGIAILGENLQWIPYINASGGNFIFIEDNIFRWHSHAIAAGGCGLYVSRYNKFYKNVISGNVSKHAIDGHGWQGGSLGGENYFSTRMMITYMDTVINDIFFDRTTYVSNGTQSLDKPMERAILTRGGEAIMHHDYIRGYRLATTISEDGSADPYPYDFGAGYNSGLTYPSTHTSNLAGTTASNSQGNGDVWIYNISYSIFDGSDGDGVSFYNYQPSDFLVDRDYHQAAKPNYTDFPYPHPNY